MNIRLCLLSAVLVVPQSGLAQASKDSFPRPDHTPSGSVSRIEIPFKLYDDYLIVLQGSLGTLDRLNFLVDTGVNPTTIDPRIAKELGLAEEVSHNLFLFSHNRKVTQVTLPNLHLGPIKAESLVGIVVDLSSFEKIHGVRIDAMVGLDLLSRSSFSIDYKSKKIAFGAIESSSHSVAFDAGPPILTVRLRIQDEPIRLLVDTGAAELVLFECHLPSRVRQLHGTLRRPFLDGAGEAVRLAEVQLTGLRLGSTDLGLQKGLEANDSANCGLPFDGVLGVARLGMKWVAFDFDHRRFSWKT